MLSFLRGANLGRCSTYLTGGRAERLAFAYDLNALVEGAEMGALVIGRGSNVLVGDAGYAGSVVVNRASGFSFTDDECICESGALMSVLAREYVLRGRTGLEWAYGLPGSAGGAVMGNAGAFGGSMGDSVKSVTVWRDGKVRELSNLECGFSYRSSEICGTVLSVKLRAEKSDAGEVERVSKHSLERRRATQPREASGGSVFKAADGTPAAVYIDRSGLKGLRVGGAAVSKVHANFIVNDGGASSADVLQLMNVVRATVFDKFGVRLEREIKLIGDFF